MGKRLVNTNPELFASDNLGQANPTMFLDELEAQKKEDRNARLEGRNARLAVREVRHPRMTPPGSVPSSIKDKVNLEESYTSAEEDTEY